MSVQSGVSQGGESSSHMNITRDQGGNSTGVYTVIWSWKRHSTDGILGASEGEVFSPGDRYAGSWGRR